MTGELQEPRGLQDPHCIATWHRRSAIAQLHTAWPSEAARDEAVRNYLARPGFARQRTAKREKDTRKTKKVTARLTEQALDLGSWPDARSSQAQEKRNRRLKIEKKRAACMGKARAAVGMPNAPHVNGEKIQDPEGKRRRLSFGALP